MRQKSDSGTTPKENITCGGKEQSVNTMTPEPVSPVNEEFGTETLEKEITDIEELGSKVKELEGKLKEQHVTDRTPMVSTPEGPTCEERERYELTHANHKSWCRHC